MSKHERYEHHGAMVSVRKDLKGKHKEHCLCYAPCAKFKPNTPDNCPLAQGVYALCVTQDMVLPVWECPDFDPNLD